MATCQKSHPIRKNLDLLTVSDALSVYISIFVPERPVAHTPSLGWLGFRLPTLRYVRTLRGDKTSPLRLRPQSKAATAVQAPNECDYISHGFGRQEPLVLTAKSCFKVFDRRLALPFRFPRNGSTTHSQSQYITQYWRNRSWPGLCGTEGGSFATGSEEDESAKDKMI